MWWRTPVGIVVNIVTFVAVGTIAFIALRLAWPEYAAVEKAMTRAYTTDMMAARLTAAALASVAGGCIAGLTLRDSRLIPLLGGVAMLALFAPYHIQIWDEYPVWYHLTFFASLPVLAFLGGALARP